MDSDIIKNRNCSAKVAIIAIGRRVALMANALLREDKLFGDSALLKLADNPAKLD